jgi:predicted flap endonuclease-1-like 5' DNA nuclease
MNGVLVIGVFIFIVALTIHWLQGRQVRLGTPEPKKAPVKEISVGKVRDWPVKEANKEEPIGEESMAEPSEEIVDDQMTEIKQAFAQAVKVIDQLPGVGPKYRALLQEAGITTINQIAESDPEDLLKLLKDTNELVEITKRPPTLYIVEQWIDAAKSQIT